MAKIKIIIVDDHQMFRDGIKLALNEEEEFDIIGEAGNGHELFELMKKQEPDLVITDISLPDISGIDISERLNKEYPAIKVLVLSMHSNEEFIYKALIAGADGYLPKETSISELTKAIIKINSGKDYFNKDISDKLIHAFKKKNHTKNETENTLTKREKEIIRLIVEGLSNKEIADQLFISIRTVDTHKNNIMHKLHLKSSVELVKYAIKNNLAELN